ncbi:MAG: hypothetical protein HC877_04990 [Thioploca sp.]|nr:hypothetical protein [Thioploca sp.]
MKEKLISNHSVNISGSATSNVIQTGDHNVGTVNYQKITLPPSESVDVKAELKVLHEILAKMDTPNNQKINNAFSDVEDELTRSPPNKNEIGTALERALRYAKQADTFAKSIKELTPIIINIAAWLGKSGNKILEFIGLSV